MVNLHMTLLGWPSCILNPSTHLTVMCFFFTLSPHLSPYFSGWESLYAYFLPQNSLQILPKQFSRRKFFLLTLFSIFHLSQSLPWYILYIYGIPYIYIYICMIHHWCVPKHIPSFVFIFANYYTIQGHSTFLPLYNHVEKWLQIFGSH